MRKILFICFGMLLLILVYYFFKLYFGISLEFPRNTYSNEKDCNNRGGVWRAAGGHPGNMCFIKTKDFNKPCSDKKDCQGDCFAPNNSLPGDTIVGSCSEYTHKLGCHAYIRGGKVTPGVCVD